LSYGRHPLTDHVGLFFWSWRWRAITEFHHIVIGQIDHFVVVIDRRGRSHCYDGSVQRRR
jgi:hypothetical protein